MKIHLLNYSFFTVMFFLFTVFMFFVALHIVRQGVGLPPMTRKGEFEEHIAKMVVLDAHGVRPDEANRRTRFFGLFSWIDDEVDQSEVDEYE